MNLKKILPVLAIAATLSIAGCGPKDADVQAKAESSLNTNPETSGIAVKVDKGVATLSGEAASESARSTAEGLVKDVKGVKSVINNVTVAAPVVTTPVEVTADDPLTSAVRDATKDHPGVTATVNMGTITLTGTVTKEENRTLMMKLNALKPGKIENNLTIK